MSFSLSDMKQYKAQIHGKVGRGKLGKFLQISSNSKFNLWDKCMFLMIFPGSYRRVNLGFTRNFGVVYKKFMHYRYHVSSRPALLQGCRGRQPPSTEEF